MGAIGLRLRAEARANRGSWIAVVLLVAIGTTAVFATVAGARRTDTAWTRYLQAHAPGDFLILDSSDFGFTRVLDLDRVAAIPGVAATAKMRFLFATGTTDAGRRLDPGYTAPMAPADDRLGREVERWKLLEGRRPVAVDEVVPSAEFARDYDLRVGSTLTLRFQRTETFFARVPEFLSDLADRVSGRSGDYLRYASLFDGPKYTFRVVGIEAAPYEFPPVGGNLPDPMHLSRAFARRHAAGLAGQDILHVKLEDGADRRAFATSLAREDTGTTVAVASVGADHADNVQRSIHLQALVLAVLAAFVACAALLAIAQAFTRQAATGSRDSADLRALGMTGRQLFSLGALRATATAAAGLMLGMAGAVLASPLFPLGLAGDAEPHPGFAPDWLVLGIGGLFVTAFAAIVGGTVNARSARPGALRRQSRPMRLVTRALVARRGLPAFIGARQVLERGRPGSSVPVRSAVFLSLLSVAAIVAISTVTSSIATLESTPRLYGWSHGFQMGSNGLPSFAAQAVEGLEDNPAVGDIAMGTVTDVGIGESVVGTFALDDVRGRVEPDLLEGRGPRRDDEIVLGTETMRDVGLTVGERVAVHLGGRTTSMEVVGRAVFPEIGDNGHLGRGARITFQALRTVLPDAPANIVHATWARDVDPERAFTQLSRATSPLPVLDPEPPTDLTNFGRADTLPAAMVAVMFLLTAAALAHTLVMSVRLRRREFAILETLGWVRAQVSSAVVAQAATLAVIALAVGIPLGILVGVASWDAIAEELGVPSAPTTNAGLIALSALALSTVALLAAVVPAWSARRVRPAQTLRSE